MSPRFMLVVDRCFPGSYHGENIDLISGAFEAVGACAQGKISEADPTEMEEKACPSCGSCAGLLPLTR